MSENQMISLQLPEELVTKMDAKAKGEYKTRTEYIKDLVIADLKQPILSL